MQNLVIKKISKNEFQNLNYLTLFSDEKTDRCFAVVSNKLVNYKFSWQSDKINPFLLSINEEVFSLGVDQNFIIIDVNTSNVLFKIYLDYFFYESKIYNDCIYIITELEIIQINKLTYQVIENIYLPDYYESIKFSDNMVIITCLNNEIIQVETN